MHIFEIKINKSIYFFLLLPIFCLSQIPPYYGNFNVNLDGQNLKNNLAQLVELTHTNLLPYTSSAPDTWDAVKQTDLVPTDTENVLLFYGSDDSDGIVQTDYTRDKDLSCHSSSCFGLFNREHVYAKSIATPSLTTEEPGPGTDAHNLRACDSQMNSARSNRLFDNDIAGGVAHVTANGRWYPGDEWKGDVARIIMYMYLRYPIQCPANDIGAGTNSNHPNMPDIFLQWNVDDPVSEYELQRNPVLESMQGNRNPFVDNPYLATKIWGGNVAEDTWNILRTNNLELNKIKVYPTIVSERLFITNISSDEIKVVIYNVNGERMKISVMENYIDVKNLSNGLYFLKISDKTSLSSFKFIKN